MSADTLFEGLAKEAAKRYIAQGIPYFKALGYNKQQIQEFIEKMMQFAIEELNRQYT